ncbi:phage tail sheath subtilisin-like domain-containing protein [Streptomyces sp. YIM 121038]|uniref:phage tail sheath family protein n=1 Tax=Streptomyces sp. YIM 121038 TaxID=2136401 RepID=UPI001486F50E|nr:phage tail sheath subtilisin-like domain-containing protein [Streptomyces sp. YIM 121038]
MAEAMASRDLTASDQLARSAAVKDAATAGSDYCKTAKWIFQLGNQSSVGKIIEHIDSLWRKAIINGISVLKNTPRDIRAQDSLRNAFTSADDDWKNLENLFAKRVPEVNLPLLAEKLVRVYRGELSSVGDPGWCLAEAVYGFFANGGSACYVVRFDDQSVPDHAMLQAGLKELEAVPEVAMVAVPDLHHFSPALDGAKTLMQAVAQHCATMKNRVAVLDTPQDKSGSPRQRALQKADIGNLGIPEEARGYSALYYPWVTVPGLDGASRSIPPCGHIAGVWARTDAQRGVFKAPANEALRGVIALPMHLTDDEQADLNEAGINCLRVFPGRGILIWGARTLAIDSHDWQYLNVRRLVCFLADSIRQSTSWAVFEPNDERLWATLRQTVQSFLKEQWRQGALRGATPDEVYSVICDASNNTLETVQSGRVICDIHVAPTSPAEFIHFQIQQTAGQTATA